MEVHNVTAARQAALGLLLRCFLVSFMGGFLAAMLACSKTQFEREHDAAVNDNPWGVELQIKTAGDTRQFHRGDTLRFQEFYTAKSARMWQLEVLDASNAADIANLAYLSDGSATRKLSYAAENASCCKWRYVTLNTDPVRLPYRFDGDPDGWFRSVRLPEQPGKYQLYVETHRLLMRKGDGLDPATHTGYPLISNDVLTIEILP
jgi:hypothetical protein